MLLSTSLTSHHATRPSRSSGCHSVVADDAFRRQSSSNPTKSHPSFTLDKVVPTTTDTALALSTQLSSALCLNGSTNQRRQRREQKRNCSALDKIEELYNTQIDEYQEAMILQEILLRSQHRQRPSSSQSSTRHHYHHYNHDKRRKSLVPQVLLPQERLPMPGPKQQLLQVQEDSSRCNKENNKCRKNSNQGGDLTLRNDTEMLLGMDPSDNCQVRNRTNVAIPGATKTKRKRVHVKFASHIQLIPEEHLFVTDDNSDSALPWEPRTSVGTALCPVSKDGMVQEQRDEEEERQEGTKLDSVAASSTISASFSNQDPLLNLFGMIPNKDCLWYTSTELIQFRTQARYLCRQWRLQSSSYPSNTSPSSDSSFDSTFSLSNQYLDHRNETNAKPEKEQRRESKFMGETAPTVPSIVSFLQVKAPGCCNPHCTVCWNIEKTDQRQEHTTHQQDENTETKIINSDVYENDCKALDCTHSNFNITQRNGYDKPNVPDKSNNLDLKHNAPSEKLGNDYSFLHGQDNDGTFGSSNEDSLRGLENRACYERQRRRYITIKQIVAISQQEQLFRKSYNNFRTQETSSKKHCHCHENDARRATSVPHVHVVSEDDDNEHDFHGNTDGDGDDDVPDLVVASAAPYANFQSKDNILSLAEVAQDLSRWAVQVASEQAKQDFFQAYPP